MSSRARVNLALAGLVLALATLAYLRPGAGPGPAPSPLSTLAPEAVSRLLITRSNAKQVLLERTPDGWQMRRPYRAAADPARIAQLLAILRAPSYRELAADPARLEGYGLAPPMARLEANDQVLEIGAGEPLGQHRYVRFRGRVHLIDGASLYLLLGQPELLLDRRLPGVRAHPIAAVELPGLRVQRGSEGRWAIEPAAPPVTPQRLAAWVQAWQQGRALEVLRAPPGQGRPLKLSFSDGAPPRMLELLQDRSTLIVDRQEGLAYRLPADSPLIGRPGPPPHG